MAKSRFIQNNFVSGELSPLLRGRTDLQQYYQACETAENVVIVPQGGMRRRPGMAYVADVTPEVSPEFGTWAAPNGGTANNLNNDNDTTFCTSTTAIGTTDDYVFATFQRSGTGNTALFIDVRNIELVGTAVATDEWFIESSADNVTWSESYQLPELTSSPINHRVRVNADSASHEYWRIVRNGTTDLGSGTIQASSFRLRSHSATSPDVSSVKLDDFSVSADENYLVEFTPTNISIFRTYTSEILDPVRVADINPQWDTYDATQPVPPTVRTAQVENVMLIVGNTAPKRLVNLGAQDQWFFDEVEFTNVPQFDFDDDDSPTPVDDVQVMTLGGGSLAKGDRFQIDIESIQSKNITFAGDSTADEQASTVFNIQKNLQDMPVFGETGVAVARTGALTYRITVSGESAKNFELFSGYFTEGDASNTVSFVKSADGSPRKEDVWSSTRGWPKTICFYEGRLVFGGTQLKPQSLFFSKAGDFFNFDTEDTDDDDGIFATISSRKLNDIIDVYPGRNLQIFTSGAEFAVTSRPVTPANVQITPQTAHGAKDVQVLDVDGSTIFVDRYGKSMLTFLFSFNEDAYTSDDRSVLASHLIKNPVSMSLLKGTASDDANWLVIVNEEGDAAVLNTLRSQDINGYTHWTTENGDIKEAQAVADNLFFVTERGTNIKTIERWNFRNRLDASQIKLSDVGNTTLSGFEYLAGQDVILRAVRSTSTGESYDYIYPARTVNSDGTIDLSADEQGLGVSTEWEAGYAFTPTIKTMPLNTNIGSGENQMRLKKIIRMNLRVFDTHGMYIDGEPVPIRQFGPAGDSSPLNPNGLTPVTGIVEDWFDKNGWGREVNPEITAPDSGPFHIQMIEYEVEGN